MKSERAPPQTLVSFPEEAKETALILFSGCNRNWHQRKQRLKYFSKAQKNPHLPSVCWMTDLSTHCVIPGADFRDFTVPK